MVLVVFQTIMMAGIVNPDKPGNDAFVVAVVRIHQWADCVDFRTVFRNSIGTDLDVADRNGQVHRERKTSRLCRALPSRLEQRTHSFRTITSLARFFFASISSCLEGCNETIMMECLNQEPPERLDDCCQW